MGEVSVAGKDAEALPAKILVNDISGLKDNAIIYSPVCYPDGGVVDDILAYRINAENFFLVVNAANLIKILPGSRKMFSVMLNCRIFTGICPDSAAGAEQRKILQKLNCTNRLRL
jgi:aminomethyltransferase